MRILVLTTDAYQVATLPEALELLGHQVHCVKHGAVAVQWLESHKIEVIVVSWDLPVAVVSELLHWIRMSQVEHADLLFWTGSNLDVNLFVSFSEQGGPVLGHSNKVLELAAKLNIVLRRPEVAGSTNMLRLGPYTLNFEERAIFIFDKLTVLTATEFDVAALLFKNPGHALSRRHIRGIIWGDDDRVVSRSLDTHMSRIRTKLELNGKHGIKLTAVYARGYRLDTTFLRSGPQTQTGLTIQSDAVLRGNGEPDWTLVVKCFAAIVRNRAKARSIRMMHVAC